MRVDLAIVGMGLSGSRALVELIGRLAQGPRPPRPWQILLFDRAGEFGRGIPYGSHSDRRAMLIEDLRGTRCPEFLDWVRAHPQELAALRQGGDDDRAWHARNAAAIEAGAVEDLYLPRHVFGAWSSRLLDAAIEAGGARGLVRVVRHVEEVVDLARAAEDHVELHTAAGRRVLAGRVLLAVGSIPRYDPHQAVLGEERRHRYVCDTDFCGSFALRSALDRFERASPDGDVRLAVIGAAASAIESLYCTMHHGRLSRRVVSVTTLSHSGMLPGGLRGVADVPVSDYARLRTSAADYVATARELQQSGRLAILAARLHSIRARGEALRIEAERPQDGTRLVVDADLVINCSGAGEMQSTPSRLLRNLAGRLPLRRGARGFAMGDGYCVAGWPRLHVAGPLLNAGTAAGDVESISAVFRVGRELGEILSTAFDARADGRACARDADGMSGELSAQMS